MMEMEYKLLLLLLLLMRRDHQRLSAGLLYYWEV
jgi:hypothetical protein